MPPTVVEFGQDRPSFEKSMALMVSPQFPERLLRILGKFPRSRRVMIRAQGMLTSMQGLSIASVLVKSPIVLRTCNVGAEGAKAASG